MLGDFIKVIQNKYTFYNTSRKPDIFVTKYSSIFAGKHVGIHK